MLHRKTTVTSDSVVVYCIIISAPPLSVCVWTIVMRCCFLTFHYSRFLDLCRRAIYTWCTCDWAAENPLPSNVVLKVHIRVDCRCGSERICEMPAKLTFIWMWLQRLSHPSNEYWILNRERFDRSSERSGSIIIIIIIINEKINVAFSRRTARTRNSHKNTSRENVVSNSTEEEKIVMKMTARRAVSSAAA